MENESCVATKNSRTLKSILTGIEFSLQRVNNVVGSG